MDGLGLLLALSCLLGAILIVFVTLCGIETFLAIKDFRRVVTNKRSNVVEVHNEYYVDEEIR